jgi:16S rRNA (cytidine1402-2'-O)-methyltransferase
MAGTLFVVATPIGNLEDISARALRVLREVDVIAAEDTRRTAQLLTRFGIATKTTSLHAHNEQTRGPQLLTRLQAGESVALVSDAGTPGISDPGSQLVADAADAGIPVVAIPGASALTTLLSVVGSDASRFTFLGFPPTGSKDRKIWFDLLAGSSPMAVFYEAPHRILATLGEIRSVLGDASIVLGRELTKVHEELVRGSITLVLSRLVEPRGEFVVAVMVPDPSHQEVLVPPDASQLWSEFCDMTNNGGSTRRQAIASLSRKYRMSAGSVYDMVEEAKKSGS